jgi:hypothetical protein
MTDFLKNLHFNEWIPFFSFLEDKDPATNLTLVEAILISQRKYDNVQNLNFWLTYQEISRCVDTFQKIKIHNYS